MRLVTREGIDRLRAANPIAAVVAEYRIELAPLGKSLLIGRCPLERGATGRSLLVSPASGRFRCLTCWAHGDVIGLVIQAGHVGFLAAVERLAARAGLDLSALMDEPPNPRRARWSEVPEWALTPPLEAR